jgi:hypothetical protein
LGCQGWPLTRPDYVAAPTECALCEQLRCLEGCRPALAKVAPLLCVAVASAAADRARGCPSPFRRLAAAESIAIIHSILTLGLEKALSGSRV